MTRYGCVTLDDGSADDGLIATRCRDHAIPLTFFLIAGRYENREKRISHFGTPDLQEIRDRYEGHEIGSHGYQHLDMSDPRRTTYETFREYLDSQSELRGLFGQCRNYAFPYGLASRDSLACWNILSRAVDIGWARLYRTAYSKSWMGSAVVPITTTISNWLLHDFDPEIEYPQHVLIAGHAAELLSRWDVFIDNVHGLRRRLGFEFVTFDRFCRLTQEVPRGYVGSDEYSQ